MFWMRNKENSFPVRTLIWSGLGNILHAFSIFIIISGAQWLTDWVLGSISRGCGFEPPGGTGLCSEQDTFFSV